MELSGSDSRVENDEDLMPQGIECITRDGIDAELKSCVVRCSSQVDIEARVVLKQRIRRRYLEHVDGDRLALVKTGLLLALPFSRWLRVRRCQ
jgi:hypothetical protein